MEKSVEFEIADYIKEVLEMKEVEPEGYSPLTLAYIGDSIYDLIIKTKVSSDCFYGNHHAGYGKDKTRADYFLSGSSGCDEFAPGRK